MCSSVHILAQGRFSPQKFTQPWLPVHGERSVLNADWLQVVAEDWMGLEINRYKAHIVESGFSGILLQL
jgi:hypothetical protein